MKEKLKSLQSFFLVLLLSVMSTATAWGQTSLSSSNFYQFYADSDTSYGDLITNASLPTYITTTIAANQNTVLSAVPSITTPHDFSALTADSHTKYWRLKAGTKKTITITNVANLKKVHFYGNGSSSTRSITTSVAKVSGSGSVFTVATISDIPNSNQTIAEYSTVDFTAQSGYDSSTYYTYTFTFSGDVALWGIYVEAGSGTPTCATPSISCTGNTVTITSATDGASIYYTTNGDTPTTLSTLYDPESKPTLTASATVKAIAVKDDYDNSSEASQAFTIYSVSYSANGGTGTPPATNYYVAGSDVTVQDNTDLAMSLNTFAGWNTADDESDTHYDASATYSSISGNVTFYAVYKHYVTISVDPVGTGTVEAKYYTADTYYDKAVDDDFTSGSFVSDKVKLKLTANPSTGYEFDTSLARPWGGATGETGITAYPQVGNNNEYVAHFKAKTYTITLDKGTGGSADGTATATYNSSTLTSVTHATHASSTLTGYFTAASGGTKVIDADGTLVERVSGYTNSSSQWIYDDNVTLYAQWEAPASYIITYVDNHSKGTVPSATSGTAITAAMLADEPTSIATGYTFLHWCTDAALTTEAMAGSIDANTTLYANYKITGTVTSSPAAGSTVKAGDAVTTSVTSSPATGMYIAQGGSAYSESDLKVTTLRGTSMGWTVSGSATLGSDSWKLSVLLTDGTFYSDVITHTFSVGVATPVISCLSNTVTITCATEGASIYYTKTTDGSTPADPTSSSTAYSSFTIDRDTKVKAIAIKSGTNSTVTTETCTHTNFSWPVSLDFTSEGGVWSTSDNDYLDDVTSTHSVIVHGVTFRGSSSTEFRIVEDTNGQHMQINSNASTNHYVAIPLEQINGRIDIYVTAPYTTSNFKVRSYFDPSITTPPVDGNAAKSPSAVAWSDYDISSSPGVYHYRIEDISSATGVLFLGVNSSSYKLIDKIRIETPSATLKPSQASIYMGDAEKDTCRVTITNYSSHRAVLGHVPSYVNATYNPSTGELVVTPIAIGSGDNITFAVDNNDDGEATDIDLSIPVTVRGITIDTNPANAIYNYGTAATALSVTASKSAGLSGDITYQWYKNTVNSNTGGTAISGATSSTYTPSTTSAAEDASFYYCVAKVASDTIKARTSNVAYVLTTSSGRKFHMSNVAGNRQTTAATETITGQVIAGGAATANFGSGDYYRYITRPSSEHAHMYVVNGSDNYISITLASPVAAGDKISVRLNGYNGTSSGIIIADASDSSKKVEIDQDGTDEKVYTATIPSDLDGKTSFTIKGKYWGLSNYFTDLIIYTPGNVKITDPTPSTQTIQSGETPTAMTVTASDGTGDFSFQWQKSTDHSSWDDVSTPTDGTVTTDGATSTFAPVAIAATRYYRCIVTDNSSTLTATSEVATITVTALTHGYYTPASYTDNKATYLTIKGNYDDQNKGDVTATSHYWSLTGTSTWGNKTISGIDNTYLRIKKSSESMTFYVKDATAFSFITEAKYDGGVYYTYTVRVDDVLIGDFETTGQESSAISLNPEGSKIVISGPKSEKDIYIGRLTFYEKQPADIKVIKDGEAVTEASQYIDGGAYDYAVTSSSTGSITVDTSAEGYDASVATASYSGGVLTVTPVSVGTSVITIHQNADANYAEATTTLTVKIQYHTISIAFSYDKSSFKASLLTQDNVIPSGSLPVLTATYDDGREFDGSIYYHSDDRGIGYFGASKDTYANSDMSLSGAGNTTYSIKYGGGQGGARIYAYVPAAGEYDQAVAFFDLVVENGTSNDIPKGKSPEIYEQYGMRNSAGEEVIRITYGGYKYEKTKTGKWSSGSTRGKYFVDGHEYYTRYGTIDALNEYNYQLKGMSDDYHDGDCPNGMWYKTTEIKPDGGYYKEFERVRPFNLPCRGSYIKFEPKKSGVLTAYVWQNGTIDESANTLGSKPRLGYWFDEDGWVQHPTAVPVTKQPLGVMSGQERKGRDGRNVDSQMASKWTAEKGDQNMAKLLKYKYCLDERPDSTTAEARFSNTKTGAFAEAYENPYYWGTDTEVGANLDLAVPKSMNPVPFHNGFLIPEAAYVKYTLNVVAGKSYYFYGMMTKIGYAGMNFVEDESVLSEGGNDIDHQTTTMHLQADDDMTIYKIGGSTVAKNTLVDEVTLPSNYRKAKWNTICLPFALSENQVEEAFGKGTQLAIFNGLNHDAANHVYHIKYLRHVDANILPGQPYLIYPSGVDAGGEDLPNVDGIIGDNTIEGGGGTTRITFNTVLIDKDKLKQAHTSYGNDVDADGSTTSYIFTASYKPTDIVKYDIYNTPKTGMLKRYMPTDPSAKMTLNTYHAVIKANDSNIKQDAITFSFSEDDVDKSWEEADDTPTEIVMVEDDGILEYRGAAAYSGKTYNMMGQEIDYSSAKGMIIVNGKKYIK